MVGKEEGEELVLAVEGGRDLGAGNSFDSFALSRTTKGRRGGNEVLVLTEEEVELRASCGIQIHRRGDCS